MVLKSNFIDNKTATMKAKTGKIKKTAVFTTAVKIR